MLKMEIHIDVSKMNIVSGSISGGLNRGKKQTMSMPSVQFAHYHHLTQQSYTQYDGTWQVKMLENKLILFPSVRSKCCKSTLHVDFNCNKSAHWKTERKVGKNTECTSIFPTLYS